MQRITYYDVRTNKYVETVVNYLEKNSNKTMTGTIITFDSISSFVDPPEPKEGEKYEKEEVFDIVTKKEKRKKHWLK